MSNFDPDRTASTIERANSDWRSAIERNYQADPVRTHSELISRCYWTVAAQLKIDYEVGRLAEPR